MKRFADESNGIKRKRRISGYVYSGSFKADFNETRIIDSRGKVLAEKKVFFF